MITLLLTSGARHPFKLDAKYLSKRNVEVPGNDPFNLSVYKLKELILREWREEWEARPASPSSIRLISFGKLLEDKAPLKGKANLRRRTVEGFRRQDTDSSD
jgi:Ubiquitin-2 like Rad60 SUMO-like